MTTEDQRYGAREELAIERRLWEDYGAAHPDVPDMGELFDALEAALKERDEAVAVQGNLCRQNTELLEDVAALRIELEAAWANRREGGNNDCDEIAT